MELASLLGRLLLSAVFLVAGAQKLRDLAGTRESLAAFGAPRNVVAPLALALPLTELIVGVLLLPAPTAWWAALGAGALLLVFTLAIVAQLARGRRPACRCFGQVGAGPIGRSTVLRNAALLAVAVGLGWAGVQTPPASFLSIFAVFTPTETVLIGGVGLLAVALAAVATLVVQLVGQQSRLLVRLDDLERRLTGLGGHSGHHGHAHDAPPSEPEGFPIGTTAPSFTLPSVSGTTYSLSSLLAGGRPLALIFTDPNCGPCTALLPEIGHWQRTLTEQVRVVVVGRGSAVANQVHAAEHDVDPILVQSGDEVADAFRVFVTPAAVVVRADGSIGSPIAAGPEPIRSLVAHTASANGDSAWSPPMLLPMAVQPEPPEAQPTAGPNGHSSSRVVSLPIGADAPDFRLPDLTGDEVTLAGLRGQATLLIFWSPACAFCHQLLPVLRAWEAQRPADSPQLLIITDGTADENLRLGLQSRMALDSTLAVGESFGATGTPSAVLVDAEGRIASSLAVGGVALLPLLGVSPETAVAAGHAEA